MGTHMTQVIPPGKHGVQPPFYPLHSFYGQTFTPVRVEADVYDCEIEGVVPEELNGTLYLLGGDTQYPVVEGDIILNGDGLMSMFRIEDGHVDFRTRYVRTERFLAERRARRRLYGKYRNPYTDDPAAPRTDRDNTANTYAFAHHGALFALREDSHPTEMDPETLDTKGTFDFDGQLKSRTVCAHPKVDPETGEWWAFGLFSEGRLEGEMSLIVADKDGKLIREEQFQAPFAGLSHDFGVTRDHVIFCIQPLTVDKDRIAAGGDFYAYDPDLPSAWGIMPRTGTVEDLRWFNAPRVHVGHVMNCFSEGTKVIVDAPVAAGNNFPFFRDIHGNPTDVDSGFATITRMTFDLGSDSDSPDVDPLDGVIGEMPRLDERFAMTKYRYGFFRSSQGISRVDWQTRDLTTFPTTPPTMPQEPIFVPRSTDAPEGDGFILSLINYYDSNRAALAIFDAQHLDQGPAARVKLPFAQIFSFHGSFVRQSA